MRERNYENQPQGERDRRFGERGGFRGRDQERYGARDEDEGFGEDFESQGFEGRGQGGWRQDYGQYGQYGGGSGRQGGYGQYGQRGQYGQYGQGQRDFGQREPGRGQGFGREGQRFGQDFERRQEYGIDRDQGYGSGQGYGSQQYGTFEQERFGQRFGQRQDEPRGRFTGRGPKGWQRSDSSVLERVNETLEQHPDVDASEIEVTCQRGEIVLRGTVDDRRAKRLAEDAIENLPGVKDVRNEIRVQERQQPQLGEQARQGQQGQEGQHNGGGRARTERL